MEQEKEIPGERGVPETEEGEIQEDIGREVTVLTPLTQCLPRAAQPLASVPKSQLPPLSSKHPPFPIEHREGQGLPGPSFGGGGGGGRAGRTSGDQQEKNTSQVKVPSFRAKQVVPEKGGWVDTWL